MTSTRAYALLTVKAVEEDKRIIRGVATTPTVDRVGDIIEPLGISFKNPMPFLWQHNADEPIGTVNFDTPTASGVDFEAELPIVPSEESAVLSARIDEAWSSIKRRLVRAVSIGFRAIEYAFMDEGGIRFIKTEVFELSAVTIPANAQAVITSAKSIDGDMLAALKRFDEAAAPAATGKSVRVVKLNAPARDRAPFIIRDIRRP